MVGDILFLFGVCYFFVGRRRRRRLQWVGWAAMQAAVVRWVWVVALAAARRRRVWEGGHPLRLREVTSVATMWAVRAECCRERRVAIPFGPGRALERLGVTGDVHRCGECMRTRVTLADPTSTL